MLDQSMMVVWGDRELTRPAPRPHAANAYQSEPYMAALQDVRDGLRRGEALIVMTGESGTGKTLLCRTLLELADQRTFTSFVVDPCESAEGLLTQVLSDFGVVDPSARLTRDEGVRVLQRFVASLAPVKARAIVIIDEAHRLQPDVAETLRILTNLDTGGNRLLHVVLAGQPELDAMLQRPDMRRIAQRVSRHVTLAPLARHEIAGYVEHRLSFAGGHGAGWQEHVVLESGPGYSGVITVQVPASGSADLTNTWFTQSAIRTLERVSGGVPGAIDTLFDRAVEIARERQTSQIDGPMIRDAARRLGRTSRMSMPQLSRRTGVAAAVIVAVAVTGAAAWARAGSGTTPARGARQAVATTAAAAQLPLGLSATPSLAAAPAQTADSVTISIASFRTEERARSVAAQLVDAGFPAFVRPRGDGLWQQVIVGPYVSRDEAAAAQRAMAAQGVEGTEVRLERTDLQP